MTCLILYISNCTRPMATKHSKMVVTYRDGLPAINSHNPLNMDSREVMWQIKNIYLHHHNSYGHKTYQYNDITQGAPSHKFAWPLSVMIMWSHVTNEIHISTCRRPINTKLGKVLTYSERLPSLKPHDPLITRPA